MASTSKILGKVKPGAATPTTLYTVPGATQAQAVIFVTNQGAGVSKIRVALLLAAGVLADTDYIAFDIPLITAGEGVTFAGIALNTGEKISVESDTGDVSFVATGIEIT